MKGTTVFLFPGQGSHFLGMGQELLKSNDEMFQNLLSIGSNQIKRDLTEYVTGVNEIHFTDAAVLQPLITSVSLALWNQLLQKGISPQCVLGHSLGEITALAPAGVITPELAVEMAAFRGQQMDFSAKECGGGGMAVVMFATPEEIESAINEYNLSDSLFIANYNAPNQTVISGLTESLALFESKFCEQYRSKIQKIDVAGPWHTPFIGIGRDIFIDWVEDKTFNAPSIDFILNGTSQKAEVSDNLKLRVADQLIKPVFWSESLTTVVKEYDKPKLIEVGPGKILTGLVRANKIKKQISSIQTVNTLDAISEIEIDETHIN